jgi:hypothetical protein|tara:strand:+ start:731 stop:847 length:117 start_codon:yes stop_codon:yes gene_type:complete
MPLPLRRFYADKLIKAKEAEQKQYDDAVKQSNDPRIKN